MLLAMLAACTQFGPKPYPDNYVDRCLVDATTPLDPSDPGDLGISADALVARLDGAAFDVTFLLEQPEMTTTEFTTRFEIDLSLVGDVEEQQRSDYVGSRCIDGTVGYAPIDLDLVGGDLVTLEPRDIQPSLTWRGGSEDQLWLRLTATVEVPSWLADDAEQYDCSVGGLYPDVSGERSFLLTLSNDVEHPWSTRPLGIEMDCESGPIGVIYRSAGW